MAAKNRTEIKSEVDNDLTAIVTISKHRGLLKDDFADSLVFRKDVKGSTIVATGSANNIDFSSNDLVVIDGATNNLDLVLTILNTADGEDSKYIRVIKDTAKTVTFSGATDISICNNSRDLTEAFYRVINKNGNVLVQLLSAQDNPVYPVTVDIGDWNMDTDITVSVNHGLADHKRVRGITCMIREDADVNYYPLNSVQINTDVVNGAIGTLNATTISLARGDSGIFNSASFDQTSFNRGWITFWIEP